MKTQCIPPGNTDISHSRFPWTLLTIIVLAFLLRIVGVFSRSLSVDEGVSWLISGHPLREIIPYMFQCKEIHPPFYFILLHFWMLLGESEGIMRMLSIFCSILDIIFTHLLASQLLGRREAKLSAFLMAVSSLHIYYSQELRMYSLVIFLFLCSFYLFLRWKYEEKIYLLVLSSSSAILGFMTHYLCFFIPMIEMLYLIFRERKKNQLFIWISGQVIVILLFSLWMDKFFFQLKAQDFSLRYSSSNLNLVSLISYLSFGFTLYQPHITLGFIQISFFFLWVALIIPLILIRLFAHEKRASILFLSIYFSLPVTVLFALSQFSSFKFFEIKYFSPILPAFFIILSAVILKVKMRAALYGIIFFLVLINFCSWWNYQWNRRYEPQNWKLMGGVMNMYSSKGDVIIVHPSMMVAGLCYYYRGEGTLCTLNELDVKRMENLISSHRRLWFCCVPFHPYVARQGVECWLDSRLTPVLYFQTQNEFSSNIIRLKIYKKK